MAEKDSMTYISAEDVSVGYHEDVYKRQEVTCLVRGLGELEPIQQLFVEHAKAAVDSLAK